MVAAELLGQQLAPAGRGLPIDVFRRVPGAVLAQSGEIVTAPAQFPLLVQANSGSRRQSPAGGGRAGEALIGDQAGELGAPDHSRLDRQGGARRTR